MRAEWLFDHTKPSTADHVDRSHSILNKFKTSTKINNILTGQKRNMSEQKYLWPVNMTGHLSEIILSPVTVVPSKKYCNSVKMSNILRNVPELCEHVMP